MALLHFLIVNFGEIPFATLHGFRKFLTIFNNARFNHLAQEVVTLAGTFTYTCKDGETIVAFGNIIDKLHDKHGLAHTSTAKEANLTTFGIRLEQVNHLDTRIEHFAFGLEFLKLRRFAMNRISSCFFAQ